MDHTNPETLRTLYWDEEMSLQEVGHKLGVSKEAVRYQMQKHGIERRRSANGETIVPLYYDQHTGEKYWQHEYKTEKDKIGVHRLVAVADGADPNTVFGDDGTVVSHKNGVSWDNRPGNVEVNSRGEWQKISNEELLGWLDAFVREFGVVPVSQDIRSWPGPSEMTYQKRFGSLTNAIRAAGYTPRGASNE